MLSSHCVLLITVYWYGQLSVLAFVHSTLVSSCLCWYFPPCLNVCLLVCISKSYQSFMTQFIRKISYSITPACLGSFFFLCLSSPLKYYWRLVKLGCRQYTSVCCLSFFSLPKLGSVKVFFFSSCYFCICVFYLRATVTCEIWFGRKSVWEF